MEKIIWKTEKRKLADLKPFEGNPRKATEKEVKDIDKSLERFNLADPLVINTTNTIIGGHLRYNRLKAKGIKEVDVRVPSRKLTGKEAEELCLRLNKNTGSFDFDLLANFEEDLLKDVGWESEELDKIFGLEQDEKEDEVPELPKKAKSKLGDLYQLGDHRLLCGDATKKEDVERLMAGEKADMIFTDPPYGINLDTNYTYKAKGKRGNIYNRIVGDEKNFEPSFIFNFFDYVKEIFLFGGNYYADKLGDLVNCGWFVWDKTLNINQDTGFAGQFEIIWSKQKHRQEIIRCEWFRFFGLQKEDIKKRVHPTQKPVALGEWFIEKFSKRGQNIIDLFGGSGSSLIAAEKLNRKCFMMEIDPLYIDVIISRWEKFTGRKAKKIK